MIDVAAVIVEADTDERDAAVGGFLAVVPCEHTEAARIDRERTVQREFGRKIRDGPVQQLRIVAPEPGVVLSREQSEPAKDPILTHEKSRDRGAGFEAVRPDPAPGFLRRLAPRLPNPADDPGNNLP